MFLARKQNSRGAKHQPPCSSDTVVSIYSVSARAQKRWRIANRLPICAFALIGAAKTYGRNLGGARGNRLGGSRFHQTSSPRPSLEALARPPHPAASRLDLRYAKVTPHAASCTDPSAIERCRVSETVVRITLKKKRPKVVPYCCSGVDVLVQVWVRRHTGGGLSGVTGFSGASKRTR